MKPGRVSWLAPILLMLCLPAPLWAQAQPKVTAAANSISGNAQTGIWSVLNADVRNPTNSPLEALVVVQFKDNPNTQFATKVWLPAKSMRKTWQLARLGTIPERDPQNPTAQAVALQTILLDPSVSPERSLSQDLNQMAGSMPGILTAYLGDTTDRASEDVVVAARKSQSSPLPANVVYLTRHNLPPIAAGWDGISSLVIASQDPQLTSAQMLALREWLLNGGKLWIQLDRTNPQFARQLLGTDWTLEVVNRSELASYQLLESQQESALAPTEQRDPPVDFVRVLAPDMQPMYRINQWPAVLRKPIGKGELFISTLAARGWLTPADNTATTQLTNFGQSFLGDQNKKPLRTTPDTPAPISGLEDPNLPLTTDQILGNYVVGQIGRQTLGRIPILLILGTMAGGMVVAGLYFSKKRNLEYATLAGIGLALGTTGLLLVIGTTKQNAVPLTATTVQVAQIIPSQQAILTSGQMAIYSPGSLDDHPLTSRHGALLWPDFKAQRDSLHRLVKSDLNQWQWEHVVLHAGSILSASYSNIASLDNPIQLVGHFDAQGFTAQLTTGGDNLGLEDLLLVGPAGRIAPRTTTKEAGLQLTATQAESLPPDQFLGGNLLSDLQDQRQKIYRHLLADAAAITEPKLLAWTHALPTDATLTGDDVQTKKTSIVSIPVEIQTPQPGETLTIPSAFLSFSVSNANASMAETAAAQASGQKSMQDRSTLFDPRQGKFLEASLPGTCYLKFTLPAQVKTLALKQARLNLDIVAPGRTVELYLTDPTSGKTAQSLATLQDAAGSNTWTLKDATLPQPNLNGTIILEIRVGEAPSQNARWHIRGVDLNVQGQMPTLK